jgi:hypothetical protein
MYKSKLFTALGTAVLLAVLLGFTAMAQAAPRIKPGGDNPGTETAYAGSGFVWYGARQKGCFEPATWCEDEYEMVYTNYVDGGDLDAFSYAAAAADLSCDASAAAHAGGTLFMAGGGLLEMNRHGKNGAMHHIEFLAGLVNSSAVWVDASSAAGSLSEGVAFVVNGVDDVTRLCDSIDVNNNSNLTMEVCTQLEADVFGIAGGFAEAQAVGQGWAGAGSTSVAGLGTWTGVWAANIELFTSVVAAGASNYVWAQAGAQATALTEAFVGAYIDMFVEACARAEQEGADPGTGVLKLCADGAAAALALAYEAGGSWAAANATALANTHTSVFVPATYYNKNGIYDYVHVGSYGAVEVQGNLEVSCSVPDEPTPP